jgi:hypothetical protein
MDSRIQKKDLSIKQLVQYLLQKYRNQFKIRDHWGGDKFAIGLMDDSEKYLIYISTIGFDKAGYYVSLENPSENDEFPYEPAGEFDNLTLIELENIFKKHLRIK